MRLLSKILPVNDSNRKYTAVGLTVIAAGLLSLLGIYGFHDYGIALFILTPFFIGFCSTILFGYRRIITMKEAWKIGFLTLSCFVAGLLLFAIEGILCVAMLAPIGIFLTWIGSLIGFVISNKIPKTRLISLLVLVLVIPTTGFVEKDTRPTLNSVVTSIEINASPKTVWENVIEFPKLEKPTEFIFKTGIAYPINAKIDGVGVGAVRYCNFTTGSFVEPITVWNEPSLLKFDVVEQPAPMKELSFWDIDAPHLHDYFISKNGQFKLTALPNGKTRLEGTTWYYHKIKPETYWRLWSDYIIHKIHGRVLNHIKIKSEDGNQKGI